MESLALHKEAQMNSLKIVFAVSCITFATLDLAAAQSCPAGTTRMIKDNRVICVPYGQGSPSNPPPELNPAILRDRAWVGAAQVGHRTAARLDRHNNREFEHAANVLSAVAHVRASERKAGPIQIVRRIE
jgi:hypothetical protein